MPDRNAWIVWLLPTMMILGGLAARLYQIGYNFDGDELFSVSPASGSFRQVVVAALVDWPHPPLYPVLLWAWLKLTGPSEVGARLLSVIASGAFLVVLWRLARRLAGPTPALFALFLCTATPFFVYYGQQARMYALIQLFATLSLYFLLRALEEPATRRWGLFWGASCVALLYTQYLGALLLLPQLAAIAIRPVADRRRLLTIGILAAASVVPWVVAVRLSGLLGRASPEYVGIGWVERPGATGLVDFLVGIFGFLGPGSTRILLGLGVVTLLSLAVRRGPAAPRHLRLVFACAAFPPAVLFLVSRYGPVSMWAPRQMIGSAVFVLVLLAMTVGLHHRRIGTMLAAGFATWIALTFSSVFPENTRPPWRALGARLDAEFRSAVVGTEDWVVLPLRYYSREVIRRIDDYPPGQCCGPRVVLVCRPSSCAELVELRAHYDQVAQEAIQFTPPAWPISVRLPVTLLNFYVFRQRSAAAMPRSPVPEAASSSADGRDAQAPTG
jgi:4-amino-4-deoxy-L-arabinose transferase-like glycosyltransferase